MRGVDAYHGVSHGLVLENIAALERAGAYLGAFSVPRTTREGALFVDAVDHAQQHTPDHPSIVNGSIAAAVQGDFGDVRFTSRTKGSELFINPLMSLYFAFELEGLARRCLYLDRIEHTVLMRQVSTAIEESARGSGSGLLVAFRTEPLTQLDPRAETEMIGR